MRRILSGLVVVAVLFAAAPASALPTQQVFRATIGGAPVGALVFDLDQEVANGCRYGLQWADLPGVPSEQCFVDEITPRGYGCFQASTMPIGTILTLPPPGEPCQGVDANGQSTPVYALVAAERRTDGTLDGVIQLDSASTSFLPFHAAPGM